MENEDSAVTLRRALEKRCPRGTTLLIREASRGPNYDRSYKVYTAIVDEDGKFRGVNLLNAPLLALGICERDPLEINHISVPGTGFNHAQHLAETIAFDLYGDANALSYEEV